MILFNLSSIVHLDLAQYNRGPPTDLQILLASAATVETLKISSEKSSDETDRQSESLSRRSLTHSVSYASSGGMQAKIASSSSQEDCCGNRRSLTHSLDSPFASSGEMQAKIALSSSEEDCCGKFDAVAMSGRSVCLNCDKSGSKSVAEHLKLSIVVLLRA